jgi:CheY-like chemotaxis protein
MSNPKILIIEDDADVRLGYHVLLKANHYDTCLASDGISAIGEARKHEPDLIILDLGLPAGDGFTVLDRLRAYTPLSLVPVIVVSARGAASATSAPGNRERALKAGARAYLQKPWNDQELLALIQQLIGEREAPAVPAIKL